MALSCFPYCQVIILTFLSLWYSSLITSLDLLQVDDLVEASKSISTLPSMVELDIQTDTVRKAGSHTRNLLRVKRGIDMVKVLFEQILVTEYARAARWIPLYFSQLVVAYKFVLWTVKQCLLSEFDQLTLSFRGNSLRDAASVAYAQVFAPHHGWAIRKAVAAGMYALPSKSQLLKKLNEDGEYLKSIQASAPRKIASN